MKAIMACLKNDVQLQGLQANKHPYLLPIVGKTILEYQFESFYTLGIREVLILVHHDALSLREFIGDGSRWGLNIQVHQQPQELNPGQIISYFSEQLQGQNTILSLGLNAFVPTVPNQCLVATQIQQLADSIWFVPAQQQHTFVKRFRGLPREHQADVFYPILKQWSIASVYDYWKCNVEFLSDPHTHPFLPAFARDSGCFLGQQVRLPMQTETRKHNFIGDRTYISPECELEQSIIGADCVIGANSHLTHSLVLDGSWIGEGLILSNKIISGKRIYDPLSAEVLELNEPIWLDDLNAKLTRPARHSQWHVLLSRSLTKFSKWMHNSERTQDLSSAKLYAQSLNQQQLA